MFPPVFTLVVVLVRLFVLVAMRDSPGNDPSAEKSEETWHAAAVSAALSLTFLVLPPGASGFFPACLLAAASSHTLNVLFRWWPRCKPWGGVGQGRRDLGGTPTTAALSSSTR